jgi:hypothetical protein
LYASFLVCKNSSGLQHILTILWRYNLCRPLVQRTIVRAVRPASAHNPSADTWPQCSKLSMVRAVRLASARNPSSDTCLQPFKLRLVRAVRPASARKPATDILSQLSKLRSVREVRTANARNPLPDTLTTQRHKLRSILSHKVRKYGRGSRLEYLIHWKGYESHDDTWEQLRNLIIVKNLSMNTTISSAKIITLTST